MRLVFSDAAVQRKSTAWDWVFGSPVAVGLPLPRVNALYIADKMIGASILLPRMAVVGGAETPCLLPTGTLTHPAHRGRGVILLKSFFNPGINGLGIGVAGFDRLTDTFARLGAITSPPRAYRAKLYRPGRLLHLRRGVPRAAANAIDAASRLPILATTLFRTWLRRDEALERVHQVDDSFDEAWRAAIPTIDFALKRDAAFLRWRYFEPPFGDYRMFTLRRDGRLVGYVVAGLYERERHRIGRIVDIFAYEGGAREYGLLVACADAHFREVDCDYAEISYAHHAGIAEGARRSGFLRHKAVRGISLNHEDQSKNEWIRQNLDKMHFTRGDHDEDY